MHLAGVLLVGNEICSHENEGEKRHRVVGTGDVFALLVCAAWAVVGALPGSVRVQSLVCAWPGLRWHWGVAATPALLPQLLQCWGRTRAGGDLGVQSDLALLTMLTQTATRELPGHQTAA